MKYCAVTNRDEVGGKSDYPFHQWRPSAPRRLEDDQIAAVVLGSSGQPVHQEQAIRTKARFRASVIHEDLAGEQAADDQSPAPSQSHRVAALPISAGPSPLPALSARRSMGRDCRVRPAAQLSWSSERGAARDEPCSETLIEGSVTRSRGTRPPQALADQERRSTSHE